MKRKSKADVGDINMESQGTVSPFEAVPSPESQSVVFFPGLASSPLEGQEARTSSMGQEIMSSPLESLGAVFSLPEDVNYTPESQGAESEVRIPIQTNTYKKIEALKRNLKYYFIIEKKQQKKP